MIEGDIAVANSRSEVGNYRSLNADDEEEIEDPTMTARGNSRKVIIATLVSALGTLTFGFNIGYSSPALVDLASNSSSNEIHLNSTEQGWFSSLMNIGALVGSLLAGWLVDRFGRKASQMFTAVPFIAGFLVIAYSKNVASLYSGRIIAGIGSGMTSLITPVYIAEIASPEQRGALGSVVQLSITFGILLSYCLGLVLNWKWLAIAGVVPVVLMTALMFFMPETPRWLIVHNEQQKAISALTWLRGSNADSAAEFNEIESNLGSREEFSWREFVKPTISKPLMIGVGMMIFQQFSGINAIMFNCASIMNNAGFSDSKAVAIVVAVVQFFVTGIACLLMDKAGRRVLLILAGIMMCASCIVVGVYFYLQSHQSSSHSLDLLAVIGLVIYITGFSLGWGPIPWLIMSEILPTRARGTVGSIMTVVNWLGSFIVTKTFTDLQNALQSFGVFWFYAGFCFFSIIFVGIFLPETKGKSLEEIEMHFERKGAGYERIST